ncbi:hypothetical protein RD792_017106 [Penstemon davidsonii]|uniref:GEX2 N-terminal Ig-like domain-containing protein n=1 Tax=Penstemon davidsonii TaxID=160366 RepID=A0ABR0CL23_9LAMI|nr:hypothetical protein RD792_017106 [Penstemon davidsonii]
MASHSHITLLSVITFFISTTHFHLVKSGDYAKIPAFAFSWLNNNDTFAAGETATIKVKVLGNYESGNYKFPFNPNITVNDKTGNSSFISGVSLNFDGGTENWRICFTPIMVGLFNLLITDEHFRVLDSSLQFRVNPGRMYPAAAVLSWKGGPDEFMAGTKAEVLILLKDAFGNNISSAIEEPKVHNFTLFASTLDNNSPANVLNITEKGLNQKGYLSIEFVAATAGSLLLHVEIENQTLQGSPLPFKVNPGKLDVYSCVVQWNVETKYFQLFSILEASIHQNDRYGNLVSGLFAFDIEVIEKGTNLSMPVSDLSFKDTGPGIQSFSFSLQEPGNFMLMISDKDQNTLISNMPYDFSVYVGYCDGGKSVVNGSGLNNSIAGDVAKFSVFLKDAYLYPSAVELESLRVLIVLESDPEILLHASIRIKETDSGIGNHKASDFDVIYKPEKSGIYEIRVFCGNIPLNGGRLIRKEVSPGVVNVSLSGVVKFATKVPKMVKNEIVVRLVDSYYNPIPLQESKLKLEIASINKSAFSAWMFLDNHNGSYTATYLANDVGTYEICASYDGHRFLPCPFGVNVYNSEYFPKVNNDTVPVWEDESIAFNILDNDYFAGGNASIIEYSKPNHGSLLQYGNFFRYTPYKGFYGDDSFSYTIADINGNFASGVVDLLILCIPPQFVSIPSNLQAMEDVISPTFGGFSGFQISYSDLVENITVKLSSQSGVVSLSPTPMQFWQQKWNEFCVKNEVVGNANELTLVGCLDVINFALQFIQFFGNENFYGDATILVSTTNKNGRNDLDVPIYVHPINDPPIINIPSFVILKETSDGVLIFGGKRDEFNFITDPDLLHFPGNRSRFFIMFSMEVSSGFLLTKLPSKLIDTTELKLKTSYQWQPLQTFVSISKHFLVKAKGIRFRGTIDECNSIMEQVLYHEGEHGAVLSLMVNDLGNHGCYPNCDEMMSMSLFAEFSVNLLRERPMSSLAAHTLGSAIVIVSIVVFSLGMLLLFFICKCAVLLVQEKKQQKKPQDIELSKIQDSQNLVVDSSGKEKLLPGCFPVSLFKGQHSSSQRTLHLSGTEEGDHIMQSSSESSSDQNEQTQASDIEPSVSVRG